VLALGNAGGAGGTPAYAAGSVTALDQTIVAGEQGGGSAQQLSGLIATDADVVAGDSGGPLVDSSGRVIGMDTAGSAGGTGRFGAGQAAAGQGYAIPINEAASIARQIEAGTGSGTVHIGATAFLGVGVADTGNGAQITSVLPGGAAARAGLVAGDTITAIDGRAAVGAGAARALGVPTIALFGPSAAAAHQLGARQRAVTLGLECSPCSAHGQRRCPLGHHRCMRDLSAETVLADCEAVLA
jgi:S1-C subfamily serine protease